MEALMSTKSFTAPGPDGFQPLFYKKYWNHVGDSLWKMVREAFQTGMVNSDIMDILLGRIPKGSYPLRIQDFHPISMDFHPISICNITYKLITKVSVNRLRPFLHNMVGPMQNNFLLGR